MTWQSVIFRKCERWTRPKTLGNAVSATTVPLVLSTQTWRSSPSLARGTRPDTARSTLGARGASLMTQTEIAARDDLNLLLSESESKDEQVKSSCNLLASSDSFDESAVTATASKSGPRRNHSGNLRRTSRADAHDDSVPESASDFHPESDSAAATLARTFTITSATFRFPLPPDFTGKALRMEICR